MPQTRTTSCADCGKELSWYSSAELPLRSRYPSTWRFADEYGCIGYIKQYKFIRGRYVGGPYGCEVKKPRETRTQFTFCVGGSESDGGGFSSERVSIGGKIMDVILTRRLENIREEALKKGNVNGVVYHESDFRYCRRDAQSHAFRCPTCNEKLLNVEKNEFYNLDQMIAQEFMKSFLPQLLR